MALQHEKTDTIFAKGRAGGMTGARQKRVNRQPGNWTRARWAYVGGAQQAKISPRAPNQAVGRLVGVVAISAAGFQAPIDALVAEGRRCQVVIES
jgi:hypothetical protein